MPGTLGLVRFAATKLLLAAPRVVVIDNTSWHNPIVLVTLLLFFVTLLLGIATAVMAWYTRRSVNAAEEGQEALTDSANAARKAAEASGRQAQATVKLVDVTTEAMRRESRPFLIASASPTVDFVEETHTVCIVKLRNIGALAVVDEGKCVRVRHASGRHSRARGFPHVSCPVRPPKEVRS